MASDGFPSFAGLGWDGLLQATVEIGDFSAQGFVLLGERPPLYDPYPPCDYCVLVSRANLRPIVDAWPFTTRDRLPTIPVPLAGADPDVLLDLQELFEDTYNSGRYALILDYSADLAPPVSGDDAFWIQSCLAVRK